MTISLRITRPPTKQEIDKFWSLVDVRGPDECWFWLGKHSKGRNTTEAHKAYGRIWFAGANQRANRVAFYLAHGYWPKIARHSCDAPPCCNERHILDGTQADNMRDAVARGRMRPIPKCVAGCTLHRHARGKHNGAYTQPHRKPRGERHGMTKFSDTTVDAVREATGSLAQIARRFQMSKSHVSLIRRQLVRQTNHSFDQ